ncbi:MAG: prepilin-type N-terminal cleavage/methylation domain-containing protein [bacterium]
MSKKYPASSGFTLIEVMVCLAISAILISLAITSYTFFIRKYRVKEAETVANSICKSKARNYLAGYIPGPMGECRDVPEIDARYETKIVDVAKYFDYSIKNGILEAKSDGKQGIPAGTLKFNLSTKQWMRDSKDSTPDLSKYLGR